MSLCNPWVCIFVSFVANMVPHLNLKQSFKEMMRFILFWVNEQHFLSKERSNTWPRVRINYPFPSYFKICFMFHISFIVWNWYLHTISIAILAIFTVHRLSVRWINVQRFIVWCWHIIVYKKDNMLCYILYFRLIVAIIRITQIYNIWCVGSHVFSWCAKMLTMPNSYFADFYQFLQFSRGNTQFNHNYEVKCCGKLSQAIII